MIYDFELRTHGISYGLPLYRYLFKIYPPLGDLEKKITPKQWFRLTPPPKWYWEPMILPLEFGKDRPSW